MSTAVPVPEIWLVRHGRTASNAEGVLQGHTDIPLDAVGEMQAEQLGTWMAERPVRPAHIVASPLSRAHKTAKIVASALDLPVELDPRIRERNFGDWEGTSGKDIRSAHAGPEDPYDTVPPNGESRDEVYERVLAAFDTHAARDLSGPLLMVTHGGPIAVVICRALDLPHQTPTIRRFRRDNTGLTILRRNPRAPGGFGLVTLNSSFHLQ